MVIREKIGNLGLFDIGHRTVDRLPLEWHECQKRILHKKTLGGRELVIRFLKEAQRLKQDDVLFEDDQVVIAVEVLACEVIVVSPASLQDMALACYEIGNKHLPLFYEEGRLLLPFDAPTYRLLQAAGLEPQRQERKLLHQLHTSVSPHAHQDGNTLFSKILKLTAGHD